jgi:hypothetical protein
MYAVRFLHLTILWKVKSFAIFIDWIQQIFIFFVIDRLYSTLYIWAVDEKMFSAEFAIS